MAGKATVEVESNEKKSNEKRGLCSQSFHVYLHTARRDAVAFLTSFTDCDMNTQTDTYRRRRREGTKNAASSKLQKLV